MPCHLSDISFGTMFTQAAFRSFSNIELIFSPSARLETVTSTTTGPVHCIPIIPSLRICDDSIRYICTCSRHYLYSFVDPRVIREALGFTPVLEIPKYTCALSH